MIDGGWSGGRSLRRLNVEGVLGVARGVVGRRVQRIEAIVFIFHSGTVRHDKADLAEAPDDVFGHLGERMEFAERPAAPRQCEIGWFLWQSRVQFQVSLAFRQGRLDLDLCSVNGFTGYRLLFLR